MPRSQFFLSLLGQTFGEMAYAGDYIETVQPARSPPEPSAPVNPADTLFKAGVDAFLAVPQWAVVVERSIFAGRMKYIAGQEAEWLPAGEVADVVPDETPAVRLGDPGTTFSVYPADQQFLSNYPVPRERVTGTRSMLGGSAPSIWESHFVLNQTGELKLIRISRGEQEKLREHGFEITRTQLPADIRYDNHDFDHGHGMPEKEVAGRDFTGGDAGDIRAGKDVA